MTKPVLSIPDMPFKYSRALECRRYCFRLAPRKWLDIVELDNDEDPKGNYSIYLDSRRLVTEANISLARWLNVDPITAQCLVYKLVEEHGSEEFAS